MVAGLKLTLVRSIKQPFRAKGTARQRSTMVAFRLLALFAALVSQVRYYLSFNPTLLIMTLRLMHFRRLYVAMPIAVPFRQAGHRTGVGRK